MPTTQPSAITIRNTDTQKAIDVIRRRCNPLPHRTEVVHAISQAVEKGMRLALKKSSSRGKRNEIGDAVVESLTTLGIKV